MTDDQDLGVRALRRVAEIWQVDKEKSVWSVRSETESEGFDWWPGDFRVRVRAHRSIEQKHVNTCRLVIRTDFLKGVPITDERFVSITAQLSRYSTSTYGWVYPPAPFWKRFDNSGFDHSGLGPTLWFSGSAYVSSDNINWLPDFLAKASIMQPINAQIQSAVMPEMLGGGVPDMSRPDALKDAGLDGMLEVAAQIYAPLGEQPSRWAGTDEFTSFADKWAQCDSCFGFGDPKGMTLETPFGNDSALIKLLTDQKHPQLGHGLTATLQLPYVGDKIAIANEAAEFNLLESASWTDFPQLGCWHSNQNRGDQEGMAFSLFIPNALHQPGIVTQVAFWFLHRARWARETKWPKIVDQTMLEIMTNRLAAK